ncbi:MAG: tRNA (adenosine(37)-N6)-threonylcarbamoyltransferase complex ATPase subunit type 1 TsaE [Nitrospinota bacterium]|nr:tRNA (adenosine(37)-N6)-threonylcarbamoyltransferase complex ATPase subunit type 1 TsaE [Nitrospinota bacterium]
MIDGAAPSDKPIPPEKSAPWFRYVSTSVEKTLALAEAIGALLRSGDLVLLIGELGAGKTTFTQGLCRGAGMNPGMGARSPTFTLINEYPGRTPIRHADLYRIDSPEDFDSIGLFDVAFEGISIIEWADKLPEGLDLAPALTIRLLEISQRDREIDIQCVQELEEEIRRNITTE